MNSYSSSGNVFSNITWSSNTTGNTFITCGICGNSITTCSCYNYNNSYIYRQGQTAFFCSSCGQLSYNCTCNLVGVVPSSGSWPYSSSPIINTQNFLGWLEKIKVFDILTNQPLEEHDSSLYLLSKTPEDGFIGLLEYLYLPDAFLNYFSKIGIDEYKQDIWYMFSPLVFKMTSFNKDKNKEDTHMTVVLGIKHLEVPSDKEGVIALKKIRVLEIKDNLSFMQLAAHDKEYRKKLK